MEILPKTSMGHGGLHYILHVSRKAQTSVKAQQYPIRSVDL